MNNQVFVNVESHQVSDPDSAFDNKASVMVGEAPFSGPYPGSYPTPPSATKYLSDEKEPVHAV